MSAQIKRVSLQDEAEEDALLRLPDSAPPSAAPGNKGTVSNAPESGRALLLMGGVLPRRRRSRLFVHGRTPRRTPRNEEIAQVAAGLVMIESRTAPTRGRPPLASEARGAGYKTFPETVTLAAALRLAPRRRAPVAVQGPSAHPLAAEEHRPPQGFPSRLRSVSAGTRQQQGDTPIAGVGPGRALGLAAMIPAEREAVTLVGTVAETADTTVAAVPVATPAVMPAGSLRQSRECAGMRLVFRRNPHLHAEEARQNRGASRSHLFQ